MKVFLSYASEDRATARAIELALRAQGDDVFFDRDDLPPGEEYHARIRRAIEQTGLLVFLISPEALDAGSYTLTEAQIAEKAWKHPARRLLPVLLRPTPLESIPPFLKSVTFLQPEGDVAATVAHTVHRIARERRRSWVIKAAVPLLAASIAIGAWLASRQGGEGADMVLVPAGAFTMGDNENSPQREVYVDAFRLDRHEVTVSQYSRFVEATGSVRLPDAWEELDLAKGASLPVIGVDWHDASAYCTWAGKRLPSEAEWEKAARGTDARTYPWGDSPPTPVQANFENRAPGAYQGGLKPVASHPAGASPFGIHDLAGNSAEWVADWYDENVSRTIRGGGWRDPADRITASRRFYAHPKNRGEDVGFRCARNRR